MQPLALHEIHEQQGAVFGEVNGREVALRLGDGLAEYKAARQGAVVVDRSMQDHVRLTGEDRVSFLHGMVTNDIKGLAVGGTAWVAMLTNKGAMVADGRVLKRDGDLLLDFEPGFGTKAKESLEKYLISEDAELQDASAEWALLSVGGALAHEQLTRLALPIPEPGRAAAASFSGTEIWVLGGNLVLKGGVDLLVPRNALAKVYSALREGGFTAIGFETYEVLRIEAGVPRYGADMDEKTIPLEANLERAIHYNKGCYIGQEVIARATFRGHMNRKLVGLLLGEATPAHRTELFAGEKKVGWVTSVVRSPLREQNVALGYVHRDFLEPGTALKLAGEAGTATVAALPLA